MFLRPVLICAAGVLALQLLAVRAAPPQFPVAPPYGWSVSESIGTHYQLGYDADEKAYVLENVGPIEPAGGAINAETAPVSGDQRLPYSAIGLKATDLWVAALLQSVKAAPFHKHNVRFKAEVKSVDFKGLFCVLLRVGDRDQEGGEATLAISPNEEEWHTVTAEIRENIEPPANGTDQSVLAFGFLMQGEGRVLIRNVELTTGDYVPRPRPIIDLSGMFDNPRAFERPVNLELRR